MSQMSERTTEEHIRAEVARRRTFAIISHPDAGKTTLTEKLLLYAGAIDLAGAVRVRRGRRHATSDWMAIERERGISITSTALQFEYRGHRLNLLDTPGHQDFSEDTYRTLMAVDSVIMVLDAAKGIESQTRKLFQVCRRRRLPILTFINKMDQPGRSPIELLDHIEDVLKISAVPANWPIGIGPAFVGVYDMPRLRVLRFANAESGWRRVPATAVDLNDPTLIRDLGPVEHRRLCEEVELVRGAAPPFDPWAFRVGEMTAVFFGSALQNVGVEVFLDALLALAPPPQAHMSDRGPIDPCRGDFSGFIFKIQANMDPLHRDRMAFLRVCSGQFKKGMVVYHPRLGRTVRMTRPHRLFARDRETLEEALPGDVVGLVNPGIFAISDTLCVGDPIRFEPIPRFQPECFAVFRNRDTSRYKQFRKGLAQLAEEGAIQVLLAEHRSRRELIVAAVGELQIDVAHTRLQRENTPPRSR
jgi:peptide chain release factor 3